MKRNVYSIMPQIAGVHEPWSVASGSQRGAPWDTVPESVVRHSLVGVEAGEVALTLLNQMVPSRISIYPCAEALARPLHGKAVIYVHQRAMYDTEGWELEVALDGRFAGRTSPGTFLMLEVEPGAHRVGAVGHDKKFVVLTAAADSVYFVRLHGKRGLTGRGMGRIELVDGAAGRKMIGAAQLVESTANTP